MHLVFFASVALLSALAALLVAAAMLRKSPGSSADRTGSNIIVARQRIEELERQQADGALSDAEADQLRQEIERELLQDVGDPESAPDGGSAPSDPRWNQRGAIAIALLIPLASAAMYLTLGDPGAISRPKSAPEQGIAETLPESGESLSIEQITRQLRERVVQDPNDQRAWLALAQAYVSQELFADGAAAYAQLRKLHGDSSEILIREADALAMAQGGSLSGEPELLLRKALSLDSENPAALWLAGLAASERQDYSSAMELWDRAQGGIEDPEVRAELMRVMEETQALMNSASAGSDSSESAIQVSVSVDSSIAESFDPQAVLFILARAVDGPPMPLAAVKRQLKDLPLTVTLDDSLAMVPSMTLSKYENVQIVARISKSGQPTASSGDAFGQSQTVRPGQDEVVQLTISEIVP